MMDCGGVASENIFPMLARVFRQVGGTGDAVGGGARRDPPGPPKFR